jgi:hypothetical protein
LIGEREKETEGTGTREKGSIIMVEKADAEWEEPTLKIHHPSLRCVSLVLSAR